MTGALNSLFAGIVVAGIAAALWVSRHWLRPRTIVRIQRCAIHWAPVAILVAVVYVVGPNIYQRAISISPKDAVGPAPASPVAQSPQAAKFAIDQNIVRTITGQTGKQPAIEYHARYATTGKHLRAFVEYLGVEYSPPIPGLIQRVKLDDAQNYIKNDEVSITVIWRDNLPNSAQYKFWWGMGNAEENAVLFFGNLQARIRLIDDEGNEQHHYFIVTGGSIPNTVGGGTIPLPYPNIILQNNVDVAAKWEEYDNLPRVDPDAGSY